MKYTILLLLLLLLFVGEARLLVAQNELSTLSVRGKIALNQKDTLKALELYHEMTKLHHFKPFDLVTTIKLEDAKEDYSKAIVNIERVLSMGYPFESIVSNVSMKLKNSEEWAVMLGRKDSLIKLYENSLNKEWILQLEKMIYADQEIRQVYMKSFKDSIRKKQLLFAMNVMDSINFVNLLKFAKIHGFPNYKSVGYKGVNDAWTLLWHHRSVEFELNPLWHEIKPYIAKEITNGYLDKDFLVMFIDHNEIENGRPMIFGSLFGYYRGQPEYDTLTVTDIENLNLRRKEMGLAPFELWIESLKLPLPLKLKRF